jgi:hypothetical protein
MELVNPLAEAYSSTHSSSLDAVIIELEQLTIESHAHAHMLSGPLQGKFLEMICRMINPKKVLEIGTFTGYSALSMLKGMPEDGILYTIELREQDAQTALQFFKKANKEQQIKLHLGNALEIIPNLDEKWDLVFIDADKVSYIDYYELTLPKLKQGGWMIADNVLFHGQVLEDNIIGKNAKAIDTFNKHVSADPRVEQLILTIRDGLTLVRKL